MIGALVEAGLISDTRTVTRVVMDLQADCSPAVYVQYEGDPDRIAVVTEALARSMPIVETSNPVGWRDEHAPIGAPTSPEPISFPTDGERRANPLPSHSGDAMAYAAAVELQRRNQEANRDE